MQFYARITHFETKYPTPSGVVGRKLFAPSSNTLSESVYIVFLQLHVGAHLTLGVSLIISGTSYHMQ